MKIIGFDLETTGLEPDKERITELCVMLFDEHGNKLGGLTQRFNPQKAITAEAERITGISLSDLLECPLFAEKAPKIHKLMQASDLIVAHNGIGFDMPFINAEFARAGLSKINTPCFDTMLEGRWSTPLGKSPNLRELCFACGVDYDKEKAHAADYDVVVMMQSFFKALRKGFFKPQILTIDKELAA